MVKRQAVHSRTGPRRRITVCLPPEVLGEIERLSDVSGLSVSATMSEVLQVGMPVYGEISDALAVAKSRVAELDRERAQVGDVMGDISRELLDGFVGRVLARQARSDPDAFAVSRDQIARLFEF